MRTRMTLAGIAAWLLGGGIATQAAYTVPAVNLPAQTPDAIRDRVARSLASTRDQVGRVLHPFRGEFHGLGVNVGGYSSATDLSGDGRVVVGFDWNWALEPDYLKPFVWSPGTGRSVYDMRPDGLGDAVGIPSVSSDGVYVVGKYGAASQVGMRAFRWSLAGSTQIVPQEAMDFTEVAAVSDHGNVVVGHRQLVAAKAICDSVGALCTVQLPVTAAMRYDHAGVVRKLDLAPQFVRSEAVDVSGNGDVVLVKANDGGYWAHNSVPLLWMRNGETKLLGHLGANSTLYTPVTEALAISADGSTVVGGEFYNEYPLLPSDRNETGAPDWNPPQHGRAVLWREATGWIDLGLLASTPDVRFLGGWATSVSGDGDIVVGRAFIAGGDGEVTMSAGADSYRSRQEVAFHWDEARGMRELADVLRLDYGLDLSGWTLNTATGISDDGTTIIGDGRNPAGQKEAWRAVLARTTPLGDIDFDGDVDPQDYAQLTSNLGATSAERDVFYADGDLNADGRVDQADAATLLGLYQGRKQGDFNADGVVNTADYTVWRDHVGQYTGGLADSNGDGWVNQADLAAWRAHFGRAISAFLPLSIPEPTAATLLVFAALAVVSRRR